MYAVVKSYVEYDDQYYNVSLDSFKSIYRLFELEQDAIAYKNNLNIQTLKEIDLRDYYETEYNESYLKSLGWSEDYGFPKNISDETLLEIVNYCQFSFYQVITAN